MPRWLFVVYRFATVVAVLTLFVAAISLVVSVLMRVASLWNWDILTTAGWQSLSAST